MRYVLTALRTGEEVRYANYKARPSEPQTFSPPEFTISPPEFTTMVPATISGIEELKVALWPEIVSRFKALVARSIWSENDYVAYVTIRTLRHDDDATNLPAKWSILIWNTTTSQGSELTLEYIQLVARRYLPAPIEDEVHA